jgi:hypothetical protein
LVGDGEPARVGEQDVEQHHVWAELGDCCQGRLTVRRLADDRVAGTLEQASSQAPEARMIVGDHDADAHREIVAQVTKGVTQ